MAGGAPIGNKNGTKGKLFYEQLRKISVQQPDRLRNVAETLFSAAELGEPWAVKELIDRFDGKAVQQTELTGADGESLLTGIQVTFVKPQHD
jgi:hypothetical protein